jgi:DNA-binding CsgD family transcriptional regulator
VREGSFQHLLEQSTTGIVLVDTAGRALYVNPEAVRVLEGDDGLRLQRGKLEALNQKVNQELKGLILSSAAAANGNLDEAGGGISIPRLRHVRPLRVVVMPLRGIGLRPELHACAAVLLYDSSVYKVVPETILCQLFGLSSGEATLVTHLARGEELREAADQLGITYETARSHLKQVFLKTDTSRQSQLVALIIPLAGRV